jgi:hypothetical protein
MPRIREFIVILILLGVVVFTSGCYTIVGYPQAVEEGIAEQIAEEEPASELIYRHYGSYRPYSYYWNYYDSYYGLLSPRSYYGYYDDYWYYPRRYYNDYYYYWDYDGPYAPQKKPETRNRGASGLRRYSRSEVNRGARIEEGEEQRQSNREIQSSPRADNAIQRSARKSRSSATSSKKRSVKRENQDEEEN